MRIKRTIIPLIAAFSMSISSGSGAPVPERIYISPNNDGIQDVLEIPLKIYEKRYLVEWYLIIEDSGGNIVRKIGNKERRIENYSAQNIFKRLFAQKKGVEVPSTIAWNGRMDNGETAPDGVYSYYFTAKDDNGNQSVTERMQIVVDNTPPSVNVVAPAANVFGQGENPQFVIRQSGSEEDMWTAEFRDIEGKVVRTYRWHSSAPADVSWNGLDDKGNILPDGVYAYRITATDRAGNVAEKTEITNIIFSAEKPDVGIAISGRPYFSPNGDGIQDTVLLDVQIPSPESSNKLVSWRVEIQNAQGRTVRSYDSAWQRVPPARLAFDGKTNDGALIQEGEYRAVVQAEYLNGYTTEPVTSPPFVMDITKPSAQLALKHDIFSPANASALSTMSISQKTSDEAQWEGTILDAEGNAVRSVSFGAAPDAHFVWDGLDDNGRLCPDGEYTYRIAATDLAGNYGHASTKPFVLDTSRTELMLTASPAAFSAKNPANNTAQFVPLAKAASGIAEYTFTITDGNGRTVHAQSGRTLPERFSWNGTDDAGSVCADGTYTASLYAAAANGTSSTVSSNPVVLDSTAPSVSARAEYTLFSPDGDGNRDVLPVAVQSSDEAHWEGTVRAEDGTVVKTFGWQGTVPEFSWDGTDNAGNIVPDGRYSLSISASDAAGNSAGTSVTDIVVDNRPAQAFITKELEAISPNGDGFKDTQRFAVHATLNEGIAAWKFALVDERGTEVRAWTQNDSAEIPQSIVWDGRSTGGTVAEGSISAQLEIFYHKGNVVKTRTSQFICSITPPVLGARTSPEYFSPDNDGEDDDLFIQLSGSSKVPLTNWTFTVCDPNNGSKFWEVSGRSQITEQLVWDGRGINGELVQSAMDYPFTFTARDELGLSSTITGIIPIDILVIREGNVLKMAVPAIIFRANHADFKSVAEVERGPEYDRINKGLEQSVIDNNIRVLKRIAVVLNKFKDYTVTIEGHANNLSGTQEEEYSYANGNIPLVPLSKERAEFVMQQLIRYGVAEKRLSAVGMGGTKPVVVNGTIDNWWKNRRVEFILNKK